MKRILYTAIVIILVLVGAGIVAQLRQVPSNEFSFDQKLQNNGVPEIAEPIATTAPVVQENTQIQKADDISSVTPSPMSTRPIEVTNGVKHSIPLDEILSGGPKKDGIPSIDNPKFISREKATFLKDDDVGLGLEYKGVTRFYPYQILVWHEIVNDTIQGDPVLVTYCPLCATGIVFLGKVNGKPQEFGVSGRLWKSNLLMYNRAEKESDESLWSQALGEAVVGPETGAKLSIIRSNTVKWGDWKKEHPDTQVLSKDTGALRSYGLDPYGNYYQSRDVSFGATFNDTRLHPKAFVIGIESGNNFKAYERDALPVGTITDTFAGKKVEITKNAADEITVRLDGKEIPFSGSFWFSWLAIHPDTELYTK